jgi:ABC-type multidrug transport system ATPase subunit
MLCGHLSPTRGTLSFRSDGKVLSIEELCSRISYAAPYIELVEEFTLSETLDFHRRFQPFRDGIRPSDIMDRLGFARSTAQKEVRFFSSGMKQRLKLALALLSDTPVVLLDEPTTNLDRQGVEWYLTLIGSFVSDRLVVVASNVPEDYRFCDQVLDLPAYK